VDAAETALSTYAATATILDPADFQQGLEARKKAVDEARQALSELRAQASSLGALPQGDLHKLWPTFSPLEKRELVSALVEAVYVEKGTGPAAERVRIETA
jgi:multidrug resistance efflux pump